MNALEKYIVDRRVDEAFADRLRSLSSEDLTAVNNLISIIKPSANSLRGIMRLLEEIAHRDSKGIAQLLSEASISDLLSVGNVKGKVLQGKLVSLLESLRYPERALLNDKLQVKLKELVREFGVSVTVPEELEGDSIVVSFKARSSEEISKKAAKLVEIGEHPACKEIYSILLGESE